MNRLWVLFSLATAVGYPAAEDDFFETRVRPVLATRCYACHTNSKLGGLRLDSRTALLEGGVSGPGIVPGKPAESLLIKAVTFADERIKMPLGGAKLKDQEIADLSRWIEMGAPWPESKHAPAASAKQGFTLSPEARKFWSLQPIQKPPVPSVSSPGWAKNPIDNFILAELDKRRMKPMKPASKRALLRRATYDLVGLPPTPEQIDAFEKDDSSEAFATVVDRLLASPHYGERWGRHWLDAVRYAEGDGPEEKETVPIAPASGAAKSSKAKARGARAMVYAGYGMTRDGYANAWRYRDWLIDAFNDDMPYDTFVKAQIAADLMPDKGRAKKLLPGLGLFGLGPWFTADCVPFAESRAEERDPKVDVLTKAFLGLTVTCARCHDHKYDPISQKDYTALVGVFNASGYSEYHLAPDDQVAKSRAHQAKVRSKLDAVGQFLETTTIDVASRSAQNTVRYMMAGRKVLLSASKLDPATIASADGLDLPAFQRWIKYLRNTEREHPYLKAWDAHMARRGGDDEAQRLAGDFQELVIDVIREKKDVELFNRDLRVNYKPDPGEASVLLPGDLMHFELFQFKHNLVQKHIEPNRYYVWMDVVQGPDASRVDDFGKRSGIFEYKDDDLLALFTPDENAKLDKLIDELQAVQAAAPPDYPYVMGLGEIARPANMKLNLRGNPNHLGEAVSPGFPAILSGTAGDPLPFTQGSGRLELAERIVQHPITARVIVNRIWMEHFGRGLVATTTNFGMMGDRPTHPELLEYLAGKFLQNGWSMKALHREIMLTATYQLSYGDSEFNGAGDPENRYLWRANLRRLDAEQLRDSILFLGGTLDERTKGGPSQSIGNPNNKKRTVYAKVTRGGTNRLLQLFDFPDPNISIDQRSATNVALQGLFFMNSDMMWNHAGLVASRLGSDEDKVGGAVSKAYRLLYGRQATDSEIQDALEFLKAAEKDSGDKKLAWQQFTQAMMSSGEFIYIN